jgi:hypothetical protein
LVEHLLLEKILFSKVDSSKAASAKQLQQSSFSKAASAKQLQQSSFSKAASAKQLHGVMAFSGGFLWWLSLVAFSGGVSTQSAQLYCLIEYSPRVFP